jgi:hypothetical protein
MERIDKNTDEWQAMMRAGWQEVLQTGEFVTMGRKGSLGVYVFDLPHTGECVVVEGGVVPRFYTPAEWGAFVWGVKNKEFDI